MAGLVRVDHAEPGITRKGRGRGFEYFDGETGEKITDGETLDRIAGLAIPPAWSDVWICPLPHGHLQAVGVDDAGRRQYRYHDEWRIQRDAEKFDRMLEFAERLPKLRDACRRELESGDKPTRERVLACAVRLLDLGFFRIGGESYAVDNESYGLATMKKEHVRIRGGDTIVFDYPAKASKQRVTQVVDPTVLDLVATLRRRRTGGEELLAYQAGGEWIDVTSDDINGFVKEHIGDEFSAKYFRTWNATVLAAVAVSVSGEALGSEAAEKRAVVRACKEVAYYLGNTPAVARDSYIDPRVFDCYEQGWTIRGALEALGKDAEFGIPSYQGRIEEAVIDLLADRKDADDLERVS